MIERIESVHNATIKYIASLANKKYRDKEKRFLAEGIRLVEEAVCSDWDIDYCLFSQQALKNERVDHILKKLNPSNINKDCRVIEVTEEIISRLAETDNPQGILAVVKKRECFMQDILSASKPLLVVLDCLQDPGNVGSVVRTADAAGATGIVLTRGCADLFSGKTVRSSMGSIFHLPIIENVATEDIIANCREHNISLFTTSLKGLNYTRCDYTIPVALILGNEGNGVCGAFIEAAEALIHIPIHGKAESLNVAAAAAVVLYEAVRQRDLIEGC